MVSATEQISDWSKARVFGSELSAVCAAIPLRGSWEPNDRIAFAMASFRLAQEHHSSILLLIVNDRSGSAKALVRPLVEAALCTLWIAVEATEKDIDDLAKGRGKLPLLAKLNRCFKGQYGAPFLTGGFEELFHSFTHGGGKALAAQFMGGDQLTKSNAVVTTIAGLALAGAAYHVCVTIDRNDLIDRLTDVVPIFE